MKLKNWLLMILAALMLLCACACRGRVPDPAKPDETDGMGLTQEQRARIERLASAFRLFGDCDAAKGIQLMSCERMIYCWYTGEIGESEVEGYGCVPAEDAFKTLSSIFSGLDFSGMIRTKYDPSEEQELFVIRDNYYVKCTDLSAFTYEITSAKELADADGKAYGTGVTVGVFENGTEMCSMELDLIPHEESVYSVVRCETHFNY